LHLYSDGSPPPKLHIPRSLFPTKVDPLIPVVQDIPTSRALPVIPLEQADDCDAEYLLQRGKKFVEITRELSFIAYKDDGRTGVRIDSILHCAFLDVPCANAKRECEV